jgi:hypothetical protein
MNGDEDEVTNMVDPTRKNEPNRDSPSLKNKLARRVKCNVTYYSF